MADIHTQGITYGAELREDLDENESPTGDYSVYDALGKQNITDIFPDSMLEAIGNKCIEEYEIDDSNFQERRARIQELYKLALQVAEKKNYPFETASNIKYPLLTKAAITFASLAYPSIVQNNQVVKNKIVGSDEGGDPVMGPDGKPLINEDTGEVMKAGAGLKAKRGERVAEFMSHQVLNDIDNWEDDTDKLLHIIPIVGCTFKKTYYDPGEKKNVSKLVLPQYLIMNMDAGSVYTASRTSELINYYPHEIEEMQRAGIMREFDYSGVSTESKEAEYRQESGSEAADDDRPHVFIEQHRRYDLDNDGYAEPYIVWVHKDSNQVARIIARFDQNDIETETLGYNDNGEEVEGRIIKIKAQSYYSGFEFFPDPEGSPYGIGFGHLLQHLNEAANTSINQLIDSGHRYVMGGGFLGKGMRIKGGDARFRPGEYKRVDTGGGNIRDNVMPLPMPEPSQVLFLLIDFLLKAAEDIANLSKVMTGEIPANVPVAPMMAAIEQGLMPFKAVFRRVHRGLGREFKRLYYLNRQYLTQDEYTNVIDDRNARVDVDFDPDGVDIIPLSDPEMVNNIQKMVRSAALTEWREDPLVNQVELRKRYFTSLGFTDVEELVQVPEPQADPIAEAQAAVLAAEAQRLEIETKLKIEESRAEIISKIAKATRDIAEAEKVEGSNDLELYKIQLDALKERLASYGRSEQGSVKQLEASPGNA